MVDDNDEDTSKEKEIDKLMALISLSLSRKSTNLPTTTFALHQIPAVELRIILYGFTEMLGMKPKRAKDAAYHREKMLLCKQEEAGIQLNAKQANWRDDTGDESDDQELEANYMYMAKLQQVSSDVDDSGPIFDKEPEQKASAHNSFDPGPSRHSKASLHNSTDPEPHAENDQVADDEFINIFSTPVQEQGETSSRHVDS
nr:hypothetical protein [Tanacetum cinerariifolium]